MIQWGFLAILEVVGFDAIYGIEQSWVVVACHGCRDGFWRGVLEGFVAFAIWKEGNRR